MIEQRETVRNQVNIPMKISLFEEVEESETPIQLKGRVKDISINGFGLEVKISSTKIWRKLKDFDSSKGRVFRLHLETLSPEKKLEANGTIACCLVTNSKKKELRIGIFIAHMDARIRWEWYKLVEES